MITYTHLRHRRDDSGGKRADEATELLPRRRPEVAAPVLRRVEHAHRPRLGTGGRAQVTEHQGVAGGTGRRSRSDREE